MKPRIKLIFILWIFSASIVYSQRSPLSMEDEYPNTSSFNLKGRVKSCHTKEFGLKSNSETLSETSSDVEKVTFHDNGFIDEKISYLNGSVSQKEKYSRISPFYVEILKEEIMGKGKFYDAIVFDSTGKIKEYFEEFLKDGSGFKNNSFYVKKCFMNIRFYYSNKAILDSILSFENKKFFHAKRILKYNNEGLLTEELLTLNDALGNRRMSYTYDKNKKLTETRTTFLHPENQLSELSKFVYNSKGDLIDQTELRYSDATFNTIDTSTTYHYKYEYDLQGNWTKATKYEGDKIESVTVRTILYY